MHLVTNEGTWSHSHEKSLTINKVNKGVSKIKIIEVIVFSDSKVIPWFVGTSGKQAYLIPEGRE